MSKISVSKNDKAPAVVEFIFSCKAGEYRAVDSKKYKRLYSLVVSTKKKISKRI